MQEIIASLEAELLQLDAVEFWLGFIVISTVSLWAFRHMYLRYHHARIIENVPTAKIRSAAQGYVELIGQTRMMDGPVIVSPLTSTVCVWFRYKIEEKVSRRIGNKRSTHWKIVKQQTSEELFMLEDETGRCVIDPEDADVITDNKRSWYKHDIVPSRRYTEELILQSSPLYAIGVFKTVANVEHQKLREDVSHLLREWKNTDPNQLIDRYDSDKDGAVSPQEWEQARKDAQRQIKQKNGHREKMEELSILRRSLQKDQAFVLSTEPEEKLIKRYKRKALLSLIGFLTSGSLAVWALNVRLGM
jgi:E3 ubiquitin ligase